MSLMSCVSLNHVSGNFVGGVDNLVNLYMSSVVFGANSSGALIARQPVQGVAVIAFVDLIGIKVVRDPRDAAGRGRDVAVGDHVIRPVAI